MKPDRGLILIGFFYCIAEYLACTPDAFVVCVCVHSEGDGLVTVAQFFGNTGNICAACNCNTGEAVAELVRVQIRYIISL